ncbi:hypothetical protein CASFOL_030256 [Castilleja foliolosa]|uniref:Late embryogenesis abundant protein LEA-2 subgroup domain-containing protein n=1 Tax=Castilleja foliolosa TaxID=1961234 RepID=A0ABD3CAH4_9LAMI
MMDETRVHPTTTGIDSPPSPNYSGDHPKPPSKPVPPAATYVVQFPREQILHYPPPENATKFEAFTRRRSRRSCCRRCCCFTLCLLLLLAVAAAVSTGVLYLVFRFKSPQYTVENLAIRGMNMTSSAFVSPGFDVTIRADNPNRKVGIYYLRGSSVSVFFGDVKLSDGVLPAFYQQRKNVTELLTTLTGSDIILSGAVRTALRNAQNQRRVPFVVRTKVPVRIKVGSVKTWTIIVKVKCDVVVDAINERANILYKDCDYSVRLW